MNMMMTSKITLSGNDLHNIETALEVAIETVMHATTDAKADLGDMAIGVYHMHCWKQVHRKIAVMLKEIDGANGGSNVREVPNADDDSERGTANGKSVRDESTARTSHD